MNVYSRIWPICWIAARAADPATPPPARMPRTGISWAAMPCCAAPTKASVPVGADYAGTADSAFAWDEFKHLSLTPRWMTRTGKAYIPSGTVTCPC